MRIRTVLRPIGFIAGCMAIACGSAPGPQGAGARAGAATLFEGARLITGDGTPPIEDSAFIVEGGTFTAVGRRGALTVPVDAVRVDLAGKTVIPGLIDAHSHIGYMKHLTSGPEN